MNTPELVPLFTLQVEIDVPVMSNTTLGTRVTSFVRGGKFTGERLSGTLLPGGGDWAVIDTEGTFRIDARLALQIDGGPIVHMSYRGRLTMPQDAMQRMAGGETLDPEGVYFRTAPVFEVEPGEYGWLNRVQAVAKGTLGPGVAPFEVYELT
ncbi:MAG TPA: DUF3237 domain-containing protein [Pseudonocardiaceae bacterium]